MALPAPAPDRTALVTGASSGIGVELARELARRGHGLTLVARREAELRTLADELATAHGVRTEVVTADLAAPDSRVAVLDAVADLGLTIDVLINNAGTVHLGPGASERRRGRAAHGAGRRGGGGRAVQPGAARDGRARPRRRPQRRVGRRLPAAPGTGRLRRRRRPSCSPTPTRSTPSWPAPGSPPRRCAPVRSHTGFGEAAGHQPGGRRGRAAPVHVGDARGRRQGGHRRVSTVAARSSSRAPPTASAPTPGASSPRASWSRSSPASTPPCAKTEPEGRGRRLAPGRSFRKPGWPPARAGRRGRGGCR